MHFFSYNLFSFSAAFVVIWSVTTLLTAFSLRFNNRSWITTYSSCSYWVIAALLITFAALRPIGAARDDFNYLGIYDSICPTIKCGLWVQGSRDWGWYSILGILKTWAPTPELMLWLSAFGLLIKFWVIFRLAKQPLMALLLFVGVFYEVLDLTAFRVALASTVFMLSFWCLLKRRFLIGSLVAFFCGFFHKQGFLAVLVLFGPLLKKNKSALLFLVGLPIGLMILGWFPDIPNLLQSANLGEIGSFAVKDGLDNFFERNYQGWRIAPIVYYPLLVMAIWLARDVFSTNNRLYAYASMGVIWAAWFLWGFASLPDVQVRFFDFMILPVVFLAGSCRFDWWRLIGVALVSGIFVVKYNILHPLLNGGFVF